MTNNRNNRRAKKIRNKDKKPTDTYYHNFKDTNNGQVIVNPRFDIENKELSIHCDIGFFQTYHSYNNLKNGLGNKKINFGNEIKYKVLSAGIVFYSQQNSSFYLFTRPANSQEAAGEIDIFGGYLNTKDLLENGKISPTKCIRNKVKEKLDINIDTKKMQFMGVQEFKDRGFYNLTYLYELNNKELNLLKNKENIIKIDSTNYNQYNNNNNPGGAGLELAKETLKYN